MQKASRCSSKEQKRHIGSVLAAFQFASESIEVRTSFAELDLAMAPYKILKQGYMMKEPPASKRGLRRVSGFKTYPHECSVHAAAAPSTCEMPHSLARQHDLHRQICCANQTRFWLLLTCLLCLRSQGAAGVDDNSTALLLTVHAS